MEDLSSISQAIQEALDPKPGQEEPFTLLEIVQGYLGSKDPNVRHLVLEVLNEIITDGSEDQIRTRKEFIFGDTVLSYLPLLLPLHSDAPGLVETLVEACVEVCSPREAILALNESCQLLEERAERCDVSKDGMDTDGDDDEDEDEPVHEADPEDLVDEFVVVVDSYSKVFARMPRIKSTPTLMTTFDAISSTLRCLLPGCTSSQASTLARGMASLIQAAYAWVGRSTDTGGEQRAILTQLLHMSIALLIPRTRPQTLQAWFLAHFPQYALLHPSSSQSSSPNTGSTPLAALHTASQTLCIGLPDLIDLISQHSSMSRVSPYAPLSALTLIAHRLALPTPISPDAESEKIDLPGVDDLLVLLSSGLSSSAVDAAGTVAWEAVHRAQVGEIDSASPLVEILMPLVTSDPDPLNRLAWFKLSQALVEKAPPGLDQILLLEQMLEPANPYDTLRPQALSLLRDLLGRPPSSSTSSSPSSSVLQSGLLDRLPLLPWTEHLELSTSEFIEGPNGAFVTDQLLTLRLLYELDKGDVTGVRSEPWMGRIRKSLERVERKVKEMRGGLEEAGAGNEEGMRVMEEFFWARLEEAAQRLKERIGQA
ncbi:uncharacterized protein MKK02DRAFT_40453 [Dioszegia hungarica]|uniref:Uncharacterized protein n=1 Tax=Dioszegia hungarica TaxID=4972 RepID=A0AA38H318_9TREE|nr:uncharacterized protein MKK02DRAFT_40453 [Dioszegia hungarica]KAI9633067.1 hypothetical protein MKK02DRAFT_40453 [Dioszegia hungarica]